MDIKDFYIVEDKFNDGFYGFHTYSEALEYITKCYFSNECNCILTDIEKALDRDDKEEVISLINYMCEDIENLNTSGYIEDFMYIHNCTFVER